MKQILLLFVGIFVALFCLEILLQTSSFVLKFANQLTNSQKIIKKVKTKDNLIKILCIGESTTYNQYTKFLPYFLDKKINKDYVVIDCGVPGTSIQNIAERINEQLNYYKPDIVVTMMGINDAIFNEKRIYKQYPIKILNLFFIIKRNIENIVVTKLYANDDIKLNYKKIVDEYFNTGKGLETLIDIITNNPKETEVFKWLIFAYQRTGKYLEVEKYSKMFLNNYPTDHTVLYILTENNIKQGNFQEAYELILKVINDAEITLDCKNEYFSKILNSFMGYSNLSQIKKYYEILVSNNIETKILDNLYDYLKVNKVDIKYYNYLNRYKKITIQPNFNTEEIKHAYLYIAQQIVNKDIVYICMGYPTIPIENFKHFFEKTDLSDKIYFVSNENNFKETLKYHSFYQVFRDNFSGTFGHCTDYGNELIAKNLAQTIIKLVE